MPKTALRPIQELYLNSNYEVITNKTKEDNFNEIMSIL